MVSVQGRQDGSRRCSYLSLHHEGGIFIYKAVASLVKPLSLDGCVREYQYNIVSDLCTQQHSLTDVVQLLLIIIESSSLLRH